MNGLKFLSVISSLLVCLLTQTAVAAPSICSEDKELYQINARQAVCVNQQSIKEFRVSELGLVFPASCPGGTTPHMLNERQYICVDLNSSDYKGCPQNKYLKIINPRQGICLNTEPSDSEAKRGFQAKDYISRKKEADDTLKMSSNFGGFRMTFDLMFGAGRWDDKVWVSGGEDWNAEGIGFAADIQMRLGYYWGSRVFVGPALTVSGGAPMFFNGAIGVDLIIPFNDSNAISASAGVGLTVRTNYMDELSNDDASFKQLLFFPFQLSYEHVFTNHFILGVTAQFNLTLHCPAYDWTFQHAIEVEKPGKVSAAMGFAGAGIHLGYAF